MRPRRGLAALLISLAALAPGVAGAQPSDVDQAREKAQDAAELLESGSYEQALSAATEAERLYHAPTHVLMIGQSLEGLKRLTEAAAAYEKLAAEQIPAAAAPVFKKAQDTGLARLKELLARVPSLLIAVRGPPADDATVTVDGVPVELTGVAVRRDPGRHQVRVEAPGYAPFERTVDLPEKGGVVVVEAIMRRASAPGVPEPSRPPETVDSAGESEGSLVPAAVAFSIGGAGLAVGAITGGLFLGAMGDLGDRCPDDRCPPDAQSDIDSAGTLGNVSTVGFALGLAGVAAGVILLVVRPGGDDSTSARSWIRAHAHRRGGPLLR